MKDSHERGRLRDYAIRQFRFLKRFYRHVAINKLKKKIIAVLVHVVFRQFLV